MGSGPPKPALSTPIHANSAGVNGTPTSTASQAMSALDWAHHGRVLGTWRRGDAQEAHWGLLGALHGTTRWPAIPPPPSHRVISPATLDAPDAGV